MLDLIEDTDEELTLATDEDSLDARDGEDRAPDDDATEVTEPNDGDFEAVDERVFESEAPDEPGSIEAIPEDLPVGRHLGRRLSAPVFRRGGGPLARTTTASRSATAPPTRSSITCSGNSTSHLCPRATVRPRSWSSATSTTTACLPHRSPISSTRWTRRWLSEADEMEAVIKLVQSFDPPGVGARDLRECLLLQLEQLPPATERRTEAIELVRDHFELLASRDFAGLARRTQLTEGELIEVMTLVRSLNPRPGGSIDSGGIEYVEPDILVSKRRGRWTVELNRDSAPRVRINDGYAGMIRRGDTSADNQYLKDNLQDAKWFLKNLEYRNETLLKVASSIVERQVGFLERGEEAMQPLVLADIATAVERHESTVSRVTTRKYMETPRGIFELKYFFSSHVGTVNGGEVSSTAIRALIRKLTAQENPRKPLSDSKIAEVLRERDIKVARRTIAKYRESMSIPPSNERRRLV